MRATMKATKKAALVFAVALAGLTAAGSVFAQHRHYHGGYGPRVSIGFGFGFPYAYPYYRPYYYAPYYAGYYPAPVVVQQAPYYVEQAPQPAPQPAPSVQPVEPSGYWYYCADSRAYYPYVKECAAGWQRVSPQPG